jgi:hypothetical protein
MIVAGDDVIGGSLDGGLQHAVVALVADSRDHTSWKDDDTARFNEVYELLRSAEHLRGSEDPADLIMDAVERFYIEWE